jgi:SAM-dependent methyltransferase
MIDSDKSPPARQAWSDYWDRHGASGQHLVGGARYAACFETFWSEALLCELKARRSVRVLDAACGDGAVARLCLGLAGQAPHCCADIHAADISPGALAALGQLSGAGRVHLVAADACKLPYADGAFDLVTSQCGLEYAGLDAFDTAARLVAPGGRLLAVIHYRDGVIFRECTANLVILDRLDASGVLAQCARLFELQHQSGDAAAPAVLRSGVALGQALMSLTQSVQLCAPGAAQSHALRLLADLATLQARHAAYAAGPASHWLSVQEAELAAFRLRMVSMIEAAADEAGVSGIAARLEAGGLRGVQIAQIRQADNPLALAWSLDAAAA